MGFLDKFRRKPKTPSGGSPIYRYEEPENRPWQPPTAYGTYAEEVNAHFASLFPGREGFVYHEILSDLVHIDVNILPPSGEDGFYVVYTTGMSDRPMTLPDELADREELKYAEVFLFLPGSWDLGKEFQLGSDVPAEYFWPIHMLKFLARFPHEYETWLAWGHTMPNGPNYESLGPDVGFGGVVLDQLGKELERVETKDGRRINLLFAIPAYREEIEYKLKYGMEALQERFAQGELPMVLDPRRPNLCAEFTEILDGAEN